MQKSIAGISLLGLGIGLSSCTGSVTEQHQNQSPNIIYKRAILLTGLHSGKVRIRGNAEWGQRGAWGVR